MLAHAQIEQIRASLKRRRRLRARGIVTSPPKSLDREYYAALKAQVVDPLVALVRKHLVPKLKALAIEAGHRTDGVSQVSPTFPNFSQPRADAFGDSLKAIIHQIEVEYGRVLTEAEALDIARRMAARVNGFNAQAEARQFKALTNVELFAAGGGAFTKPVLDRFVSANVGLIESIPVEFLGQVQKTAAAALQSGTRAEDIEAKIIGLIDSKAVPNVEARAALIARDQIGKLNGQLAMARQQDLGIKRYIWRTALDDRVRESHAEKEGQMFAWDDPPEDTGHVGQDYSCRCYPEPVILDLLDDDAGAEPVPEDVGPEPAPAEPVTPTNF